MAEDIEIIRARTKDDAAILIGRLMKSQHRDVVLVLPKNSILTADLNSLKILKEEAESIEKKLSISTDNDEIKTFAEKIQLPVYNQDSQKKEGEEKKIKRMLDITPPIIFETKHENKFSDADEKKDTDIELEKGIEDFYAESPNKATDQSPVKSAKLFSLKRITASFVVFGILLAAAAMYLILPRANVKISLNELSLKAAIPVAVSKNINSADFANGIIPGQYFLLTKSGSKTIEPLNGDNNLPLSAGGTIYIYNAYSATPQKLVAQTRFETKDGKIFKIQKSVIVPGAKMSGSKLIPSSVKADVISDGTGEEYQIGPSYFTIPGFKESPKYAGFYAKSTEAMIPAQSGSLLSRQIEKTKQDLKDELVNKLKDDTLGTLKNSDLVLIEGASDAKIDEVKVDSQTVSMKITWQAIFFKESDFRSLLSYFVANKYPDLKNFEFKDKITYPQATKADFKKGESFFTFDFDENAVSAVDLNGLKKELTGLDESGMRNVIYGKNFINSATISLWPFWVKQAPNPEKINITIDK